jgi:hypothetical protein
MWLFLPQCIFSQPSFADAVQASRLFSNVDGGKSRGYNGETRPLVVIRTALSGPGFPGQRCCILAMSSGKDSRGGVVTMLVLLPQKNYALISV